MPMAALSCPSCGATHEPRNPGIAVIVCDNCDTTLYVEEEVLKAGRKAVVGEPKSGMGIGKSGRVGEQKVDIVGRAKFQHDQGSWDEWYVEFPGGDGGWLVEDGRSFTLERQLDRLPEGATPHLKLGNIITVEGVEYEVRETGLATCVGAQGQLPRPIQPLEVYVYVDCSEVNGTRRLMFEFEENGEGEAFVGQAVAPEDVHIEGVEPPPVLGGREADTIRCAQCASPVIIKAQRDPVETVSCGSCDAVLQLTDADNKVIGNRGATPNFVLEIGDSGELQGVTWEVVGRLRYYEDGYDTDEYIRLSDDDNGYLWLEYDDLHFIATRKAASGPSLDEVFSTPKKGKVRCGEKTYRIRGGGVSTLVYVDGALPWAAHIGHKQEYVALIAPPKLFVVEGGNGEVEHYEGEWMPSKQVLTAFGREDRYERPTETHFLQPNGCGIWVPFGLVAILFFMVNLCICLIPSSSVELTRVNVPSSQFGQVLYSEPFTVPRGAKILELKVKSDIQDGGAYAQIQLVPMDNPDDTVVVTGAEVYHYQGYEDGEYWQEAEREAGGSFLAPEAGDYKMAVLTQGESATTRANVQTRLYHSPRLIRYNCCIGSIALIFGMLILLVWRSNESERFED
jgi:hypothetical protein